jgi:predicted transcriptional regulator of viral defense system
MMTQNIKYIGEKGSNLIAGLLLRGKRIFTFKDAIEISDNTQNIRETLSSLVKSGWLRRIEKGKYLILPLEAGSTGEWSESEFIIASVLIQPNYIGLQTSLNYYGYSERVTGTVYIISTRRKLTPYLDISGVRYRFVTVKQNKFFGFNPVIVNDQPVNISDREKTIIDCLDFQDYSGGIIAVARALWYGRQELKFSGLVEYAVRYGNKAVCQRLGYLLEILNTGQSQAIATLANSISNSYARLDSILPAEGKYNSRWKIILNVPETELLQWRFD